MLNVFEEMIQLNENNRIFVCKKLCNFVGIYLYKFNNLNAKLCMLYYIVSFGICSHLFITISIGSYGLLETMYTSGITMAYLTCLSVVVKRNHLVKVFETLENGIFLPNSDRGGIEEKHLMDSWIASLNKLGLLTSPIVAIMVICTYTIWKFTKYLQLPFGVFVGIINDEITAFIQCVWFCSMGLGYFFIHVTFFTILSHIKLHLTNLQTCIKHLLQNSSDDYLKNKSDNELNEDHVIQWKYLQIRLQQVVDYHSAILDVSKLIDKAFNLCHLVKCISVSYLLCLLIHGISKISISDGLFWLLSSYIAILIVLMHVVNYYGNEIIIESQNIANCCYNIEFVGTNIKLQKGLLLMIQRSQRPIVMTVGKFAPLSIATSIAVMRATYSYYMVLHTRN